MSRLLRSAAPLAQVHKSPLTKKNTWDIPGSTTAPGTYRCLHLLLVTLCFQLKFIHQSLHPAQIFLVLFCLKWIGMCVKGI